MGKSPSSRVSHRIARSCRTASKRPPGMARRRMDGAATPVAHCVHVSRSGVQPVTNAHAQVSDYNGDELASGHTDRQGLLNIDQPMKPRRHCSDDSFSSLFISTCIDDPTTDSEMTPVPSNCKREHHPNDDAVQQPCPRGFENAIQLARDKWLVCETQTSTVLLVAAARGNVHIGAPTDGTIFALDPISRPPGSAPRRARARRVEGGVLTAEQQATLFRNAHRLVDAAGLSSTVAGGNARQRSRCRVRQRAWHILARQRHAPSPAARAIRTIRSPS